VGYAGNAADSLPGGRSRTGRWEGEVSRVSRRRRPVPSDEEASAPDLVSQNQRSHAAQQRPLRALSSGLSAHAENSALSDMHFYALTCMLTHVLRLGRDSPKCVVRPCRCPQGRSQFADSDRWAEGSITAVSRPRFPGSACALSGHDVDRPAGSVGDVGGLRQRLVLPNPPAEEIKVAPLCAEDRAEAPPGSGCNRRPRTRQSPTFKIGHMPSAPVACLMRLAGRGGDSLGELGARRWTCWSGRRSWIH
jgi:hypothetical protein